jgi:hypothetical protein
MFLPPFPQGRAGTRINVDGLYDLRHRNTLLHRINWGRAATPNDCADQGAGGTRHNEPSDRRAVTHPSFSIAIARRISCTAPYLSCSARYLARARGKYDPAKGIRQENRRGHQSKLQSTDRTFWPPEPFSRNLFGIGSLFSCMVLLRIGEGLSMRNPNGKAVQN